MFAIVDDDRFGPLHVNPVAVPPMGFAFKLTVPLVHIGPLLVGDTDAVRLTVTAVVYTVAGLQPGAAPLLTVNE